MANNLQNINQPQSNDGLKVLNGCLTSLLLVILIALAGNELKRSNIRLQQDKTQFEHKQDRTVVKTSVEQDTLKIGSYQKTYMPLLRQIQRQKGN